MGRPAPNPETSTDSLRALAHSGKTPMSVAACTQDVIVDSAAVVAHEHSEVSVSIFELYLDAIRPGMEK